VEGGVGVEEDNPGIVPYGECLRELRPEATAIVSEKQVAIKRKLTPDQPLFAIVGAEEDAAYHSADAVEVDIGRIVAVGDLDIKPREQCINIPVADLALHVVHGVTRLKVRLVECVRQVHPTAQPLQVFCEDPEDPSHE